MNSIIPRSEHAEQAVFVAETRWKYKADPEFNAEVFFAVPNGMWVSGSSKQGKYHLMQKYFDEGFKPGVADILYLQARGGYHYLAIEMKAVERKNEKLGGMTEAQRAFLRAVEKEGGLFIIAYGADDAIQAFANYMQLEKEHGQVR